jgi:tetraacyldisaccharide 4'-kinase
VSGPRPPRYWFDGSAPPAWARALSALYAGAIALRRGLYRRGLKRSAHPGVPVLIVGNLIAGGSGKTPLTIAVVERLRAAGWTPGVASRGYGRRDAGTARWVDADTDPALGGDEPVLIAHRTGAKVRVDRDRVAAARALVAAGCDVVVCDDGLQHYRLARDIEIEVIDGARRYGNGRLLPAGPLREPAARLATVDAVVFHGAPLTTMDIGGPRFAMTLEGREFRNILNPPHTVTPEALRGKRVHAVAGIGNPQRFFDHLRGLGLDFTAHPYPDHHAFAASDIEFAGAEAVLMTEKDAVKCIRHADERHWALRVDAQVEPALGDFVLRKLGAWRK